MADYSQKEKELEREHLEKLVKEEDRSIKPMKEFESPEDLYHELIASVRKYHPSADISLIEKAYHVARDAHEGQTRKSGEPYIVHPLCVAIILAEMCIRDRHHVDLDCRHFVDCRRYRRHEHHAGIGDGADAGDRSEKGDRGAQVPDSWTVSDGGGGAHQSGRSHRRAGRNYSRAGDLVCDDDAGGDQRSGSRGSGGVFYGHRNCIRCVPVLQGGEFKPDRCAAA